MPEQLSLATVATVVALAVAVFGGAFALAHHRAVEPAPAAAPPRTIRLAQEPIGELRRVSPLPALVVPPPRPEPVEPDPVLEEQPAVVPAAAPEESVPVPAATPPPTPTPTPAPAPAPKPSEPARKPLTFDDSG